MPYNYDIMSVHKKTLDNMLRLALTTTGSHYQYYHNAAMNIEHPKIKALLMVLAETESDLMEKINHMIATGVLDEIIELGDMGPLEDPDELPFDLTREDSDPRIYVCNKALQKELKGYGFFLSIAARAKAELISRIFEYLAHIKLEQIRRIRRVCETF